MNPVVETFSELFKPLERAKPEPDYRAKGRQDLEEWAQRNINAIFSKALGIYSGVTLQGNPAIIEYTEEVGSAGDTITYDVNNPATWEAFVPPDVLMDKLPEPVKKGRK